VTTTDILLGLSFVLILRLHAGRGGCGTGHGEHEPTAETPNQPRIDDAPTAKKTTGGTKLLTASIPPSHRSGGRH
jgi:hypothetical protein